MEEQNNSKSAEREYKNLPTKNELYEIAIQARKVRNKR